MLLVIAAALKGCASQPATLTSSISASTTTDVKPTLGASSYTLSQNEQEMECKELTGRMQVRILEVRDTSAQTQTSTLSQLMQSGFGSLFASDNASKSGPPPRGADVAMLEAYNRALVAKGCMSFNLAEDLRPKDVRVTPVPTIKAANQL
ncbi:MAG: hypothetical protein CTY31_03395 [Hyphomicrobium sp.]|nr:MAG: hypothetical protein CTY39_02840 [Hyphomicrobium sp.]PPD01793.1 MAG: hypothetical protein CTY31_03395 [Hyphomicrobium sp.]